MMKKALLILMVMAVAAGAVMTSYVPPDAGGRSGNGFTITVTDTDVDAAWELIDQGLNAGVTYTPGQTDTTIRAAYSNMTWFDSLNTGNAGASTAYVYLLANTHEESGTNNMLSKGGTPAFVTGIYGNCYSAKNGTYLYRNEETDFRLGTNEWTINAWFRSRRTGNPTSPQVIWAAYESPVILKLDVMRDGKLFFYATDDYGTSCDSVRTSVDYNDSTWHQVTVQRRTNTAYIMVDGHDKTSIALTNANAALNVDTLQFGAFRGATSQFTGKIDNTWYAKVELDSSLIKYSQQRANGADTAVVHLTGIRDNDSSYYRETITPTFIAADVTDSTFRAWEGAWVDTTENQPIFIYGSATSPRSSIIDSIAAGQRWGPFSHRFFGKNDQPVIEKAIFTPADSVSVEFELRVYSDVGRSISYTNNYYVAAKGMVAKNGGSVEFDFGKADDGRGLYIGPRTYIAGYAKGAAANSSITMTLSGVRKGR